MSQRNVHKNRSNFNSISGAQNRLFSGEKNWGVKTCVAVPLMLCKSMRKVNKQTWQCTSIEENEDFNPIFWFQCPSFICPFVSCGFRERGGNDEDFPLYLAGEIIPPTCIIHWRLPVELIVLCNFHEKVSKFSNKRGKS